MGLQLTQLINHCIDEIRKVKLKKIGIKDKMVYYMWMENIIATQKKKVEWVAIGDSQIK